MKISLAVVLGLGFSIAVILSTIGIMDGFVSTLKSGLQRTNGDMTMTFRRGFFEFDQAMQDRFLNAGVTEIAEVVQTESFLIKQSDNESEREAKGVLARGVDTTVFGRVVGMDLKVKENEIVVGSQLAELLKLKIGDEVVLTMAKGNSEVQSLPQLISRKIGRIVNHGVYQKDLRIVYFNKEDLQQLIDVGTKVNQLVFNIPGSHSNTDYILSYLPLLKNQFSEEYMFKPFWKEFGSLIEAVHVEKILIGLVLQVVVIISIFNILAFIMYVNEKRARDFFLVSALGLPRTELAKVWYLAVFALWLAGCFLSIIFVQIFKILILKLSIINLPPEIYFLGAFDIQVGFLDYLFVFGVAFLWIYLMSWFVIRKIKKRSLLEGLRQEFS